MSLKNEDKDKKEKIKQYFKEYYNKNKEKILKKKKERLLNGIQKEEYKAIEIIKGKFIISFND